MNHKAFQFAVFIGRFQPYHNGHHHVIKLGLEQAETVIVLCGSAHVPPSYRNPWSFRERRQMILDSFAAQEAERITVLPLIDSPYNDSVWMQSVQTIVNGVVQSFNAVPHRCPKVALIGHSKDHTSYYLHMFPQWASIPAEDLGGINATAIRSGYFADPLQHGNTLPAIAENCPHGTRKFLEKSYSREAFDYIYEENQFVENYQAAWRHSPYPPVFVTVDAVVVQSGHVLMVRRGARPGRGLMALPGGFIGQYEKLLDACIRELREETHLKVPEPVLRGSIKRVQVFDDPYRSARGRTVTQAFLLELPPSSALPKVKGGDDAAKAFWLPLAEMAPEACFEDHYFIVRHLLGE
ncbi:MAG: bifunctional nicotinamide-nucleotide adenylyltransferase/Nudix hydroxylase [Gammaproteobacteria bacterium]